MMGMANRNIETKRNEWALNATKLKKKKKKFTGTP